MVNTATANDSTPATTPVRILHLSDLHLCEDRRWDFNPVLRKLTDAVKELDKDGLGPDAVAITGDIANTGSKRDYEIAAEWINQRLCAALPRGVAKRRVFIVPGNHDVDRGVVSPHAKNTQSALLRECKQDEIKNVLEPQEERRVLLKHHKAYLKFNKDYGAGNKDTNVPWWNKTLTIRNQRVRFVGLCSSWLAWSDDVYGKLLIGRWQINTALEDAAQADWTVVLVHHPWWWLAEFDATEVEANLQREAHIVLHGHLHRQTVRAARYPQDGLELAAGSVYAGSEYGNAFQLIELYQDERKVGIHQRLWHDGEWITNMNLRNVESNGLISFDLNPWGPAVADGPHSGSATN